MGKFTNWVKETRSFLAKEVRVFNGGNTTPNQNLALMPNWFFNAKLGMPRGINIVEIRQYAKETTVQMVINTILRQLRNSEWEIVPKDTNDKEALQRNKKEIEKLKLFLEQPNRNGDTFWDVWGSFIRDVTEIDAGVILKGKNASGDLVEIFSYDASRFLVNIDEYGIIDGYYQYSFRMPQSAPKFFKKEQIIYGKLNTNGELFPYGWSPLQSLQPVVEIMIQSTRYNKEFYQNNAIPDGLVSLPMDQNQLEDFKLAWQTEIKGKPHKLLFHNSDANFTPLRLNNKDMEWLEGQKWYSKQVFGAYGVSSQEAGFFEQSSRATGESQERITVKNAIKPYLQLISDKINREIIPDYLGGDDCEIKFSWVMRDEASEKIEHDQTMQMLGQNVLTINEVRSKEGLDPVEWGDKPMALIFQESKDEGGASSKDDAPKDREDKKEDRDKQKDENEKKKRDEKSIEPVIIKKTEEIKKEEAKDYADFLDKQFSKWETSIIRHLDDLDDTLEKAVFNKTFGEFLRGLFNSVNTKGFRKGLAAVIKLGLKDGVARAEKELKIDIGIGPAFNQSVDNMVERQLEGFYVQGKRWNGLKGVSEDVQRDISEIVTKGIANKAGLKVIKNEIKDKMTQLRGGEVKGVVTEGRAMKIARTESNRFINQGKLAAFKDSGLKGKKKWNSFHDNRTSDICIFLNNQVKELDDNFIGSSGAEYSTPPSHPNCRSVIEFVFPDEE